MSVIWAADKAADLAAGNYRARRVTIGTLSNGAGISFFFSIKAEGDNWQDAIDAAKTIK